VNRPQWITAGVALLLVAGLYAATGPAIFGVKHKPSAGAATAVMADNHAGELTIDSILLHARENLTQQQQARLNFLESSQQQATPEEKTHLSHQLSRYWRDSVRMFEPYAWYTAEAARLENSENSLTFAAHLFLNNLRAEDNPAMKHWKAHQAKDLFERSLKLNPANDSSAVGLGAVYLFGDLSSNPMEGIQKIREVIAKDSTNAYAQMTLGHASLLSGQLDKAIERFHTVVRLDPRNLEAVLSLAEAYERQENTAQAIYWYKQSLPIANIPGLKEEVERRIKALSK
jgi:tetratricopeptide (TPR) repeat protein